MSKPHNSAPARKYPELTPLGLGVGLAIGVILTASMTFTGMKLGFTIPGSEIGAILGFLVLRGILQRRTILENNITQTIASGVNTASAGVIFTIPALYILGVDMSPRVMVELCFAAIAGAVLGVAFIIPVRKQMIEIDRLRFPSGVAVGAILKSPGAGVRKGLLLIAGIGVSVVVTILLLVLRPGAADPQLLEGALQEYLSIPKYVDGHIALSLFALGGGFLSGKAGLTTTIGGVLAYWIISPLVVNLGWVDADVSAGTIRGEITRPIGIGMLVGGALMGILLAFPALKAAFAGLRARPSAARAAGGVSRLPVPEVGDELGARVLYIAAGIAFVVLMVACYLGGDGEVSMWRTAIVAVLGSAWLWLAGLVVAQCTGMTDWSPLSGMALVAVTLMLLLTGENTVASVAVGVAVAVAISQGSDMMQDLKTGHLVGAVPRRQQVAQFMSTWLGPIVAMIVLAVLAKKYVFGTPELPAPQGDALAGAIQAIKGAQVPIEKYAGGLAVGAALSASGVAGLGVLVGLSMYLPAAYIIYPYGAGCVLNVVLNRTAGARWCEDVGLPIAAGFIVGESMTLLVDAFIKAFGEM